MNELIEDVGKIVKRIVQDEPLYGAVLLGIEFKFSNLTKFTRIIYLNNAYELHICVEYWSSLNQSQKKQLLLYELINLCFGHPVLYNILVFNYPQLPIELILAAFHIESTCYLKPSDKLNIPDSLLTLELAIKAELLPAGTKEKLGALDYIKLLIKTSETNPLAVEKALHGSSLPGNCSANLKEKPQELDGVGQKMAQADLDSLLRQAIETYNKSGTSRGRGLFPGDLFTELIDRLFKINTVSVDFRKVFRNFIGSKLTIKTELTKSKPSFRFPDSPGTRRTKQSKIAIAIDSSGSVSDAELELFKSEIHRAYKSGFEIDIIHCDATIQRKPEPYKGKPLEKFYGRGGTDFDPVIKYIADNPTKYSALVYLTDGDCPAPRLSCPIKILWLVSRDNVTHLPGIICKIEKQA